MDPKGNVWIKNEFTATKIWPNPHFNFLTGETIDLEKEYKEKVVRPHQRRLAKDAKASQRLIFPIGRYIDRVFDEIEEWLYDEGEV